MTTFNPQQQQAIEALNANVIVSASAGAGKTTVLIARLMKRILNDNVSINEIVAMTFTEAAAREMKVRLLAALNDAYALEPSPFLQTQISLVETAQISTIHAFCLIIIKNYGYVLGMDPIRAQNILDDAAVTIMKKEAFNTTLNQWLHQNYEGTHRLLTLFSANPLDFESLYQASESVVTWIQSKKNPDHAIATLIKTYQSQDFKELPAVFKHFFINQYRDLIVDLLEGLQSIIAISDATFDAADAKHDKFFQQSTLFLSIIPALRLVLSDIENESIASLDTLINILNFKIIPYGKSEAYTVARDSLFALIGDFATTYTPIDVALNQLNQQVDDIQMLLDFSQSYLNTFSQNKVEANCLDFSDFEHDALAILRHNDFEIAKRLQPLYQEIMVDEFQDTNEYQDEIIRLISNGHNIFRVGDIKQSIYKFRGAKPSIMKNLIDEKDGINLFLSYNYRSKEPIVSYNNVIFERLMNLSLGMTYTKYDHVNTGIDAQKEDCYPVAFHIITPTDTAVDESANQLKARHIAQEIIRFHKQGMAFKDMVILVRGHHVKTYLKEAFETFNIPHFLDDQSGFYKSEVVQAVLNFLRYANTRNDYYLVQLLLSVFVGETPDTLATLRIEPTHTFKQSYKTYNPLLFERIETLCNAWKSMDIVSILQDIYTFNDTYSTVLSLQDKTNLDFLLDKAISYQASSSASLSGFIRYITYIEDDTSSEAAPLSADADVVTAMTIHKSKGLQFPVVFLWGTGRHQVKDHEKFLVTDEDLGIGLNHISTPLRIVEKNILRDIMEYKQNHEEMEESLRLLYVALTRPQQHLIIVDALKEFEELPLTRKLLFDHKRKSQLLYAASPKDTTVLKMIDPLDIEHERLPDFQPVSLNQSSNGVVSKPRQRTYYQNPSLDLNRYSQEGMRHGSILHEAIEVLPNTLWDETHLKAYPAPIQKRLRDYNNHPLTRTFSAFSKIYHETSYMTQAGEGIIDFYAIEGSRLVLVDFKSDNASAEILKERYASKILEYRDILHQHYPNLTIETYIYSFKLNDYLEIA